MDRIYVKNPDVVFRKIADEYILVPIRRKVGDLESIYTLNEVSAKVWELIDGKNTVENIKDKICEDFEVNVQEAKYDTMQFLKQLGEIEAIILLSKQKQK